MNQKVRAHVYIKGDVQGVSFRIETREKAQEIGVFGWVRNLPDGGVETVYEGEKEKVKNLIEWSKRGTTFARVNDVEVRWEKYQGEFDNFQILY